jgi:quinol monooxygenase YgiN
VNEVFGTIGRVRVKPENKARLVQVLRQAPEVSGLVRSFFLFPKDKPDEVLMVAMFEDEDAYYRSAQDPALQEGYLRYRELLEDEPQWTDGEWLEG